MKKIFSRRSLSRQVREEAAEIAFLRPHPEHLNNGEESAYRNSENELSYIANYSKGLPHNDLGEVDPKAYRLLLKALCSGNPDDFEAIPRGCTRGKPEVSESSSEEKKRLGCRRLINPQAALAFDLEGADAQSVTIRPAPRIDGAENACEAIELYWMALLREVNFTDFRDNCDIERAAEELSNCSDFRGPKEDGKVTPDVIFRGSISSV